ncbi:uncharacterized protein LOC106477552, partial [Limulus polyphemus]|uniref:Uncharacterized protein LOC106477552 n=1 Tax=Limulus polyphemus TaxID=6850 RepID=A0ABM1C3L2_LIMPO
MDGGKKFVVPSISEIDEFVENQGISVQQHFQPGLLPAESITNKTKDNKCSVQQKEGGDSDSTIENTNVPDHKEHRSKNCPGPSTTFESAFVHLKNSKYYSLIPPGKEK